MKKKIIALISGAVILIIAAGSIYGKKNDSFYSTKFSTDRWYATSLDMNI